MGNGGINSTQNDMYKWYQALKTNKIVSKSFFEKLTTPYIGSEGSSFQYAYGWGITKSDRNTKRITHNGSNGAFSHSIIWNLEEDVVILYATNTSSPEVDRIAYTIEKMVFDKNYQANPIKVNPYFFVYNFTNQKGPENAKELYQLIKNKYSLNFKTPDVLNRMGHIILNEERKTNWAIELFKLNVKLFSDDGNLWDSLAEGFIANGQKEEAIKSYKKAVELGYTDASEKLKELLKTKE